MSKYDDLRKNIPKSVLQKVLNNDEAMILCSNCNKIGIAARKRCIDCKSYWCQDCYMNGNVCKDCTAYSKNKIVKMCYSCKLWYDDGRDPPREGCIECVRAKRKFCNNCLYVCNNCSKSLHTEHLYICDNCEKRGCPDCYDFKEDICFDCSNNGCECGKPILTYIDFNDTCEECGGKCHYWFDGCSISDCPGKYDDKYLMEQGIKPIENYCCKCIINGVCPRCIKISYVVWNKE